MVRFACIYLHIGLHKTGSSAIQLMCDENRNALADAGVWYPLGRWHGQLGSCFSTGKILYVYNRHAGNIDEASIEQSDRNYILRMIEGFHRTHCDRAVLSYEGFIDLRLPEIVSLREFLRSFSDEVRVIAYCRHPLSFVPSEISQCARMGTPTGRRPGQTFPIPKFEEYLSKFEAAFGRENLTISDFSRDRLEGGDVRLDFLSKIGIKDDERARFVFGETNTNESLSAEAVSIAEAIAELLPPASRANLFFLRFNKLLSSIEGSPLVLSEKDRAAVMAQSRPHLDYLERVFGLSLQEPTTQSESGPTQLGAQTARSLARHFIESDLVSQAYRWLLDRAPESEAVIFGHLVSSDGNAKKMRQNVMRSPEFRRKVAAVLAPPPVAAQARQRSDDPGGSGRLNRATAASAGQEARAFQRSLGPDREDTGGGVEAGASVHSPDPPMTG